jgi:tetratricopeptide (TPR) repeat protein
VRSSRRAVSRAAPRLLVAGLLMTGLLVAGLLSSCVYFNTFYNAEKYFAQAERARAEAEAEGLRDQRSRSQYVPLYDKAVRKASVVLEKHPESDLVDDAMFIAGRALYWQRDYQYAMRSFRDLEINFPQSEYYDRARLWRARSMVALGISGEASTIYNELIRENSRVGDRAGLHLGEIAEAAGDRPGAILEYRRVLEVYPDSPLVARLWVRVGEVNLELGGAVRLDSAMAAFDRALLASPVDSTRYRASLNRGRVQYLRGEPEAALETYRSLLRQGRFREWEGETRILIGRYYRERGLLSEALGEFERVRDDFPQTDVSAMALYETGQLYLQEYGQRDRARQYFAEVSLEKRGTEADSLANVALTTSAELDGLVEQVWLADSTAASLILGVGDTTVAEGSRDDSTVMAAGDSALAVVDSLAAATSTADSAVAGGDPPPAATTPPIRRDVELPEKLRGFVVGADSTGAWEPIFSRPDFRGADPQAEIDRAARESRPPRRPPIRPSGSATLEEHLFLTAELYRDRLGLPDSAASVYYDIVEHFPASSQRSRALYSLAWIHFEQRRDPQRARPYLEQLVAEYGATAHANAARSLLDLPQARTAEEEAASIYEGIEARRRSDEPAPAWIAALDSLSQAFPSTRTAARAAYMAAWATENVVDDSSAAAARYDSVAARFPQSDFADLVERRRRLQSDGLVAKMQRELKMLGQALSTEERLTVFAAEPDSVDSTSLARKYLGFARRAHRQGDYREAERLYEASLYEKQAANGDARAGLGDVAWRQGYFEDAVTHMRQAIADKSTSVLPQYRLFAYHVQRSQEDSANHYLRQVTRRDRDNPAVVSVIDRFPTVASAEPEPIELDDLETVELQPSEETLTPRPAAFGLREPPLVRTPVAARLPSPAPALRDSIAVLVGVLVDSLGRGDSVRVFRGDEPFATAAAEAVAAYRFYPAEDGRQRPVPVWVEVAIPFVPSSTAGAAGQDSLAALNDSLAAPGDSLAAPGDSLAAPVETADTGVALPAPTETTADSLSEVTE